MGRIAIIKMTVLPKMMFLFQALPIISKMEIIDKWQRELMKFVWADKRARINMKSLCDIKENGGLQMPNLKIYFEAVCLSWLQEWILVENNKLLKLEGNYLSYGWHAYLLYEKSRIDRIFTCHIIRKALFKVWNKYKRNYREKRPKWIIPMEVLKQKVEYDDELKMRYEDLIEWQGQDVILKNCKENLVGGILCRVVIYLMRIKEREDF